MVKSTVVDSTTGKSKDSRVRTSSGMFLQRGRDKVIRAIEKRIADYTFIPMGMSWLKCFLFCYFFSQMSQIHSVAIHVLFIS